MTTLQQDTNAALVWPITRQGRQMAQRFAQAHHSAEIAGRVHRNTLAVWVVHDFLTALGIASEPTASDSWNPVLHLMEDIADLHLPGIGVLECRPVAPTTEHCFIPLEARSERAGYVMVVLDESAGEATLLGFSTVQQPVEIELAHLQAVADLPEYLQGLTQTEPGPITQLGQWLEGTVEAMWQAVDALIAPQTLTPAFRQLSTASPAGLRRAKRLVLDAATVVVLVVGVAAGDDVMELVIQLYPAQTDAETLPCLPAGIVLSIVDASGTVVLMARSKATDNALRLSFDGQSGEAFSLQVGWQSMSLTERFVI
ncbi:MAG: DUF1822 family protein [Cyanobacteria bacterium J06632_22]